MSASAQNKIINSPAEIIDIEKILKQLEALPTLPNIIYELGRVINNPRSSATEVSKILECDQSLAAKVLKMVNSAYYGVPGGIGDLDRAISYLGYDAVNQLVLTASVFTNLNKPGNAKFNLAEFWKHALGVAMGSETIAKWTKFHSLHECFSSGLLHDLGKVALYLVAPNTLDEIIEKAAKDAISIIEAERQMGTLLHTHVGALLAKMWKLPPTIEMSILYHHESDSRKRNIMKADINHVVDIVYLSNGILHQLDFGNSGHSIKIPPNEMVLKRLNITEAQMPLILKDIERNLETVDDFVNIIAG